MKITLNNMIQSEQQEAARVRRFLDGEDISQESPLWLAPGVPSFYNAVMHLAPQYNIVSIAESVTSAYTENGNQVYVATVTVKRGNCSRAGAATSQDQRVAKFLAYRNAVRQLIPQNGVKLVWQDKQQEARQYA
jgi:hypothetical protein